MMKLSIDRSGPFLISPVSNKTLCLRKTKNESSMTSVFSIIKRVLCLCDTRQEEMANGIINMSRQGKTIETHYLKNPYEINYKKSSGVNHPKSAEEPKKFHCIYTKFIYSECQL